MKKGRVSVTNVKVNDFSEEYKIFNGQQKLTFIYELWEKEFYNNISDIRKIYLFSFIEQLNSEFRQT